MRTDRNLEPLVTLADVAKLTGESLAVWRKRILHRQIDFVKCGRNVRIHPASLKEWLARRIVPAGRGSDTPGQKVNTQMTGSGYCQ